MILLYCLVIMVVCVIIIKVLLTPKKKIDEYSNKIIRNFHFEKYNTDIYVHEAIIFIYFRTENLFEIEIINPKGICIFHYKIDDVNDKEKFPDKNNSMKYGKDNIFLHINDYNNEKYNSDSYFIFSVFIKMNFGEMYEINVRTREDVDVLNDNIKKNNEYESESCKIFVS